MDSQVSVCVCVKGEPIRFLFLLFANRICGCLALHYLVFWFVCCWEFVPDLRV